MSTSKPIHEEVTRAEFNRLRERVDALELVRASTQPEVEGCTCLYFVDGLGGHTGRVAKDPNCPVHSRGTNA